ncbi:hypothetical protein NP233_g1031 [Leucocoprinus birnbaumii]|uniref:Ribonuclease H1 N-terminal domain-containing protein n=1 Tax=Leucocoprinus birnbaumii TaxID=56174 RepID=A0AAD5YW79_9AGAR|nr:hypothetical protein NP233_g1031 [Leucocoprinus birnbaumii]
MPSTSRAKSKSVVTTCDSSPQVLANPPSYSSVDALSEAESIETDFARTDFDSASEDLDVPNRSPNEDEVNDEDAGYSDGDDEVDDGEDEDSDADDADRGSENNLSSGDEVLPPPATGRKVHGVASKGAFTSAFERSLHGAPALSKKARKSKKTYVVYRGWKPGVFATWPAASLQTVKFAGACVESFPTFRDACLAYDFSKANGTGGIGPLESGQVPDLSKMLKAEKDSLWLDPDVRVPKAYTIAKGVKADTDYSNTSKAKASGKIGVRSMKKDNDEANPISPPTLSEKDFVGDDGDLVSLGKQLSLACPPMFPGATYLTPTPSGTSTVQPAQPPWNVPRNPRHVFDQIYVVIRGATPGIYDGLSSALKGIGDPDHPNAYVEVAANRVEALKIYSKATLLNEVIDL